MIGTCTNCCCTGELLKSLCGKCYRYQLRHGIPRPENAASLKRRSKHLFCVNCGDSRKDALGVRMRGGYGMCRPCLQFWNRHGRMRTESDRRRSWKYGKPRICRNCKQTTELAGGLCTACFVYRQRCGKNRPRRLWREECSNCQVILNGYKSIKGRCAPCQRHMRITGVERPECEWHAPLGWCECGDGRHPVPATHMITVQVGSTVADMPVCDTCHAEEQRQRSWYGGSKHDGKRTGGDSETQSRNSHSGDD